MAVDTYIVLANQYDTEEDALADYDAVRKLYTNLNIIDTYDAAVLTRKADGKVEIVKRVEEATTRGAGAGLLVGMAVGVIVALFPATGIGLAAGVIGGAIGAAIGAIAELVSKGIDRSDLKQLGELLGTGKSGLVVIAATDIEAKVEAAITKAKKRAKTQLQADINALKKEIKRIAA